MVAFAVSSSAGQQGCPEGYLEGPDSTPGKVHCIFVGYEPAQGAYAAAIPEGMDDFLVSVRDRVYEFADRLPNYLCDQSTERFKASSNPPKWKRQDRIQNEILFLDGRESYREFLRNGKKLKDPSPMVSGMWSTGEFGTMLLDLFSADTAAQFEFLGEDTVQGVKARLYEFTVAEENSHWELTFGGEMIKPAYTGSLWVDPETLLVRRLEVAARELPITYAQDVAEVAVEFGPVKIGDTEHLLAVNSAVLACRRWKDTCTKNESVYTNYRMFSAESTVMQTDSTVTFEGEDKAPPKQ